MIFSFIFERVLYVVIIKDSYAIVLQRNSILVISSRSCKKYFLNKKYFSTTKENSSKIINIDKAKLIDQLSLVRINIDDCAIKGGFSEFLCYLLGIRIEKHYLNYLQLKEAFKNSDICIQCKYSKEDMLDCCKSTLIADKKCQDISLSSTIK